MLSTLTQARDVPLRSGKRQRADRNRQCDAVDGRPKGEHSNALCERYFTSDPLVKRVDSLVTMKRVKALGMPAMPAEPMQAARPK